LYQSTKIFKNHISLALKTGVVYRCTVDCVHVYCTLNGWLYTKLTEDTMIYHVQSKSLLWVGKVVWLGIRVPSSRCSVKSKSLLQGAEKMLYCSIQLSPPSAASSPSPVVSLVHSVRLSLSSCIIKVESL